MIRGTTRIADSYIHNRIVRQADRRRLHVARAFARPGSRSSLEFLPTKVETGMTEFLLLRLCARLVLCPGFPTKAFGNDIAFFVCHPLVLLEGIQNVISARGKESPLLALKTWERNAQVLRFHESVRKSTQMRIFPEDNRYV